MLSALGLVAAFGLGFVFGGLCAFILLNFLLHYPGDL